MKIKHGDLSYEDEISLRSKRGALVLHACSPSDSLPLRCEASVLTRLACASCILLDTFPAVKTQGVCTDGHPGLIMHEGVTLEISHTLCGKVSWTPTEPEAMCSVTDL